MVRAVLYSILALSSLLPGAPSHADDSRLIRLATTTSTENSGLLTYLLHEFERTSGFKVHVIAVGTGKALRMGRDGDVDVLLVHAPSAERNFVDAGHGTRRHSVMYNDFVLVGPRSDPAGIASAKPDAVEAMRMIARSRSVFVSRGDDSGTHKKERSLWQASAIRPAGSWYREAGQGMGKVLQMAGEMDAYTLTDRGTWLALRDKSPLSILFQGDPRLHNPYGIIAVNPQRYADANQQGAAALIDWITSAKGQRMIGDYRVAGSRLFNPSANR